ncbi:MAG: type 2 isopentenyl-diphosphate Delta-isomerase [Myxococcota bacterium]
MRRLSDKLAHIDAALDGGSEVPGARRPGALTLEQIRLRPAALPECDLDEVDTSTSFLGKRISAPVMVSPMTGGLQRGGDLNRRMARAAEEAQIPFGVGSQRVALEVETRAKDFQVRDVAPTIPLIANLGAVQLVKGYGADHALRAVEMIEADGLYLHLNAMQEVVQEGGDTQWTGVLRAIEGVCLELARRAPQVPVFAREVGFGLPREDVRRLIEAGVAGVDCAGGGGTSWSLVEGRVAEAEAFRQLGDVFADWGLTTPEAVLEVRSVAPSLTLVASGGVRTGLDVVRLLALGADVAGMASPILRAAADSEEACRAFVGSVLQQIRAAFFGVGARDLASFRSRPRLYRVPSLDPLQV